MKPLRAALAAVATVGLLATGAGVGVTPFPAQVATAQTAAVDGIPTTANLHIHKLIGLPSETNADGTVLDDVPGVAAPGITFHVYPVKDSEQNDIDLTTPAGWTAARDVDIASLFDADAPRTVENVNADRVGTAETVTTDGAGLAAFADLRAMLYLVVEETNPVTTDGRAVAGAAPFLVTVPMTNPEGNAWLNTVHVYPKNQAAEAPVKTVSDPSPITDGQEDGSGVGQDIRYTISNKVPTLPAGTTLPGFLVTDKLDANLGEPQIVTVTAGGTPLAVGTDYTVITYQVGDRWVLRVELNATGAGKLTAGENLVVEFDAEVEDVPANGSISNTAWALPTAPVGLAADWDPEAAGARPGTVSNTTVSKYGQINITKTDTSDAAADLAGATFELHRCTTEGDTVTRVNGTGPIPVGGQTAFTTTENGGAYTATISGIHLGNVMPNADGTDVYQDVWAGEAGTTGTTFCLVETLAPDGYSVLPQPVAVELTATADTTELVTANQTIENVKANAGATLPLTGGIGIWLLVGGSLLALIAGIYWDQKQRARRA